MKFVKLLGKNFLILIVSVLFTAIFATLFQTQKVIAALNEIGTSVSFPDRVSMSFYDLSHLGITYGVLILLAFLAAFLVAGTLYKFIKFGRLLIYSVAGGTAIFVMLLLMKNAFFDVPIIAGARDSFGLALQTLAGIFGGFIFAVLTAKTPRRTKS